MKRSLALLGAGGLLLLVGPFCPAPIPRESMLVAQEPVPPAGLTITGPKLQVPYRLVKLQVTGAPADYTILWDFYPNPLVISVASQKTPTVVEWVAPPGTYQIRCRAFKGQDVLDSWYPVQITTGTKPEPKPPDPVEPVPPTPTAPVIPGPSPRALIVYETGEVARWPPAQASVLYSKDVRAYLNAKCATGPDGKTKEWRIWDQNVDTSKASADWQAAMTKPRGSIPWLFVVGVEGKGSFEGPLPADVTATMELLKKYLE